MAVMRIWIALLAVSGVLIGLCTVPAEAAPPPAQQQLWHPGAALPSTARVAGDWQVEATPNPTTRSGYLNAVSCSDPSTCMAVGWYETGRGAVASLAERWDGSGWQVVATADPAGAPQAFLDGISCVSASFCVAVGYFYDSAGDIHPLGERWTGTRWVPAATPDPPGAQGSGLFGVSCSAADACWAVGTYNDRTGTPVTLAESWNGTAWRVRRSAVPSGAAASQLAAVSCPDAGWCTATGSLLTSDGIQQTLAESWNGSTWTVEPAPEPAGALSAQLTGVSCPVTGACVAVGSYLAADQSAAAFGGTRDPATSTWAVTAVPTPAGASDPALAAVSCSAVDACTAAGNGSNGSVAERWNGSRWAVQDPQATRYSAFTGVSCTRSRACVAAGYDASVQHYPTALVDTWDGTTWQPAIAPGRPAATASETLAVSCSDAGACTSVGFTTRSSGRSGVPLAERWDGRRWTIQATPHPSSLNSVLQGVSCASATSCVAVGYYFVSDGVDAPLAETWNGHTWRIRHATAPPRTLSSDLDAVSCSSATSCTAVGAFSDSDGNETPFAERWDGTTWLSDDVAVPGGATSSRLAGISCTSATNCTAVGDYTDHRGVQRALAEASNADGWRLQTVPSPAGATSPSLSSVSCVAVTACTAVGEYFNRVGDTVTLVDVRMGGGWFVRTSPNQPGAVETSLTGISCLSAAACAAVGSYVVLGPNGHPLPPVATAAAWNGIRWQLQSVGTPAGTGSSKLDEVSCAAGAGAQCHAVGYTFGSSGHQVTYAAAR